MMSEAIQGTMTRSQSTALGYVAKSRNHERELCRMLVAAGYAGKLVLHDAVTSKPRLTFKSIVAAAKLTVREDDKIGPVLVPYRQFDRAVLQAA